MKKEEIKKYWKMPSQLRLEYDLKVESIEKKYYIGFITSFLREIIIMFGLLFIVANLFYLNFKSLLFFDILFLIVDIVPYILVIGLILDMVSIYERINKGKKLRDLFLNGKAKL